LWAERGKELRQLPPAKHISQDAFKIPLTQNRPFSNRAHDDNAIIEMMNGILLQFLHVLNLPGDRAPWGEVVDKNPPDQASTKILDSKNNLFLNSLVTDD
jgi:hypothetical protein